MKNFETTAIKMKDCKNVVVCNNKAVGFDKLIDAEKVEGLKLDNNKTFSERKKKWYKDKGTIIGIIVSIIMGIVGIIVAFYK